jgi:uncharacterized protein (TIGR02246 family)
MKVWSTLTLAVAVACFPALIRAQEDEVPRAEAPADGPAEDEEQANPFGPLLEGLGGEGGSPSMIAQILKTMPPEEMKALFAQFLAGLKPDEKQAFRAALLTALEGVEEEGAEEETVEIEEDPIHDELRKLRDELVAATNKPDLDAMLALCTDNVTFTPPDARLNRGHDEVRRYYEEMMTGPDPYVKSFKANPEVDDLAVLYGGDTGVATGTSTDHFELKNGMEFDLKTRWSATVVKEKDGQWRVANYQTAVDVFDNPLLNAAKNALYWTGGIAGVIGLLAGSALTFVFTRFCARPA